jgi:DNA anti-recombination protein RmuC
MKSVGLTDVAHGKLKKYCERQGLGMGEFITAALVYFEKHGINPATHESPAAEMNRLIKRLDQVIAFIRKQESELLRPMVEAVSVSEARIEQHLRDPARGKQVQELGAEFDNIIQQLNRLLTVQQEQAQATRAHAEKLAQEQSSRQLAALAEISRFLDEKNKGGLMGNLTNIFK